MRNFFTTILISILLISTFSCQKTKHETKLKTGFWKGEIAMQNKLLPFIFEVTKNDEIYSIQVQNGGEILEMENVEVKNDSLYFTLHIFDIDIKAAINNENLSGTYTKNYIDDYSLPFKATYGIKNRFEQKTRSTNFDGKWAMEFKGENGEISQGVGIFKTDNQRLTGTILTPTGDYRYLEGFATNSNFTLYSFDGNHAFIFEGTSTADSIVTGNFWSGKNFKESFIAKRNDNAKLPDANTLTHLKEGYDKISFSFPNLDGELVSLNDEKYKNKVVIVQIFGTWCPNCKDETKFLTEWYQNNKDRNVAIIGLAFEAKDDFNYAKRRVEKMIERLQVPYDFLIAGTSNKDGASKALPMLNKIISFPTTIIIDKQGNVQKIHTGFSGPATGEYYLKFVEEFNTLMDNLLDN